MVRVCVFPNCTNKMTRWTTVSFHRLPFHDLDLLKLWLVVLKLDPNSTVEALRRADHRVCSIHFAAEDFVPQKPRTEEKEQKGQRMRLIKNAIPKDAAGTADTMELEMSTPFSLRSHEGSTNISDSDSEDEPQLPLSQFYPYIRCSLCCGFLIDATTITECLHSFCKSCIVKHFFSSTRCPTCSIVVHQTQPLYNIRPDRQLQDIVFKMFPSLEELERKQMINFYKSRGLEVPKSVVVSPQGPVVLRRQRKENIPESVFTIPPELDVSLLLEFVGAEEGIDNFKPLERRYVRVSGEATIRQVELFIRRKMELSPSCQVDMVCGDHILDHYQSLRDIQSTVGQEALQDGLLVLHFGLFLPSQS